MGNKNLSLRMHSASKTHGIGPTAPDSSPVNKEDVVEGPLSPKHLHKRPLLRMSRVISRCIPFFHHPKNTLILGTGQIVTVKKKRNAVHVGFNNNTYRLYTKTKEFSVDAFPPRRSILQTIFSLGKIRYAQEKITEKTAYIQKLKSKKTYEPIPLPEDSKDKVVKALAKIALASRLDNALLHKVTADVFEEIQAELPNISRKTLAGIKKKTKESKSEDAKPATQPATKPIGGTTPPIKKVTSSTYIPPSVKRPKERSNLEILKKLSIFEEQVITEEYAKRILMKSHIRAYKEHREDLNARNALHLKLENQRFICANEDRRGIRTHAGMDSSRGIQEPFDTMENQTPSMGEAIPLGGESTLPGDSSDDDDDDDDNDSMGGGIPVGSVPLETVPLPPAPLLGLPTDTVTLSPTGETTLPLTPLYVKIPEVTPLPPNQANSSTIHMMELFLQYRFREELGLPEEEAIHAVNLLKTLNFYYLLTDSPNNVVLPKELLGTITQEHLGIVTSVIYFIRHYSYKSIILPLFYIFDKEGEASIKNFHASDKYLLYSFLYSLTQDFTDTLPEKWACRAGEIKSLIIHSFNKIIHPSCPLLQNQELRGRIEIVRANLERLTGQQMETIPLHVAPQPLVTPPAGEGTVPLSDSTPPALDSDTVSLYPLDSIPNENIFALKKYTSIDAGLLGICTYSEAIPTSSITEEMIVGLRLSLLYTLEYSSDSISQYSDIIATVNSIPVATIKTLLSLQHGDLQRLDIKNYLLKYMNESTALALLTCVQDVRLFPTQALLLPLYYDILNTIAINELDYRNVSVSVTVLHLLSTLASTENIYPEHRETWATIPEELQTDIILSLNYLLSHRLSLYLTPIFENTLINLLRSLNILTRPEVLLPPETVKTSLENSQRADILRKTSFTSPKFNHASDDEIKLVEDFFVHIASQELKSNPALVAQILSFTFTKILLQKPEGEPLNAPENALTEFSSLELSRFMTFIQDIRQRRDSLALEPFLYCLQKRYTVDRNTAKTFQTMLPPHIKSETLVIPSVLYKLDKEDALSEENKTEWRNIHPELRELIVYVAENARLLPLFINPLARTSLENLLRNLRILEPNTTYSPHSMSDFLDISEEDSTLKANFSIQQNADTIPFSPFPSAPTGEGEGSLLDMLGKGLSFPPIKDTIPAPFTFGKDFPFPSAPTGEGEGSLLDMLGKGLSFPPIKDTIPAPFTFGKDFPFPSAPIGEGEGSLLDMLGKGLSFPPQKGTIPAPFIFGKDSLPSFSFDFQKQDYFPPQKEEENDDDDWETDPSENILKGGSLLNIPSLGGVGQGGTETPHSGHNTLPVDQSPPIDNTIPLGTDTLLGADGIGASGGAGTPPGGEDTPPLPLSPVTDPSSEKREGAVSITLSGVPLEASYIEEISLFIPIFYSYALSIANFDEEDIKSAANLLTPECIQLLLSAKSNSPIELPSEISQHYNPRQLSILINSMNFLRSTEANSMSVLILDYLIENIIFPNLGEVNNYIRNAASNFVKSMLVKSDFCDHTSFLKLWEKLPMNVQHFLHCVLHFMINSVHAEGFSNYFMRLNTLYGYIEKEIFPTNEEEQTPPPSPIQESDLIDMVETNYEVFLSSPVDVSSALLSATSKLIPYYLRLKGEERNISYCEQVFSHEIIEHLLQLSGDEAISLPKNLIDTLSPGIISHVLTVISFVRNSSSEEVATFPVTTAIMHLMEGSFIINKSELTRFIRTLFLLHISSNYEQDIKVIYQAWDTLENNAQRFFLDTFIPFLLEKRIHILDENMLSFCDFVLQFSNKIPPNSKEKEPLDKKGIPASVFTIQVSQISDPKKEQTLVPLIKIIDERNKISPTQATINLPQLTLDTYTNSGAFVEEMLTEIASILDLSGVSREERADIMDIAQIVLPSISETILNLAKNKSEKFILESPLPPLFIRTLYGALRVLFNTQDFLLRSLIRQVSANFTVNQLVADSTTVILSSAYNEILSNNTLSSDTTEKLKKVNGRYRSIILYSLSSLISAYENTQTKVPVLDSLVKRITTLLYPTLTSKTLANILSSDKRKIAILKAYYEYKQTTVKNTPPIPLRTLEMFCPYVQIDVTADTQKINNLIDSNKHMKNVSSQIKDFVKEMLLDIQSNENIHILCRKIFNVIPETSREDYANTFVFCMAMKSLLAESSSVHVEDIVLRLSGLWNDLSEIIQNALYIYNMDSSKWRPILQRLTNASIEKQKIILQEKKIQHSSLMKIFKEFIKKYKPAILKSTGEPMVNRARELTNCRYINACYMHSGMLAMMPSLMLIPEEERSSVTTSVLTNNFNHDLSATALTPSAMRKKNRIEHHAYRELGEAFSYLRHNLRKSDKEKARCIETPENISALTGSFSCTNGLNWSTGTLDARTGQAYSELMYSSEVEDNNSVGEVIKEMITRSEHKNLHLTQVERADIASTPNDDVVLQALMDLETIQPKRPGKYSPKKSSNMHLKNIVFYNEKMRHFITLIKDERGKYLVHTNALKSTDPAYVEFNTLKDAVDALQKVSANENDTAIKGLTANTFIVKSFTYISEDVITKHAL